MFSLESVNNKKTREELRSLLHRITDLTNPNLPPLDGEFRTESRSNRSIPVLVVPWEDDRPLVDETTTALTKDFSDRGLALILHQPFHVEQVVVGFLLSRDSRELLGGEPRFLLGDVVQNVALGGGYWQLCLELSEVLTTSDNKSLASLVPYTAQLVPSR